MNSNSGVAFSPPSIVKDTLGDSGMLLDTEAAMTNSPGSSPSQVPKVMNNAIKTKMDQEKQNVQLIHRNELQNRFAHTKLTSCSIPNSQNCTVPIKVLSENRDISGVKYVNYKIQHLKVEGTAMQSQFNPYADENDSGNNFQLSKTVNVNCNRSRPNSAIMTDMLSKPRIFGNDRSNLMQISTRSTRSTRPQNIINLRRENFHTINISNNMIMKNPSTLASEAHTLNQNSQLSEDNAVMFRNYDLNDEYWFNFE